MKMETCVRCGKPCLPGQTKNPAARPFKRTQKGLCENCVVTQFLLSPDMEALRIGITRNGVEVLLIPEIQEQFAAILRVGRSELQECEIDWQAVVDNWELPFPKGYKP